jgi:putative oxidoreductase
MRSFRSTRVRLDRRFAALDLLARLLLCLVFVQSLIGKAGGFAATAAMMSARGLPLAPLLLGAAMALMAVGSVLVISGWRQRLGAVLLLVFLLPTTAIFHLDLADPTERIAFFKNLSIAGGLLLVTNRRLDG